jgi:hypothetical protein
LQYKGATLADLVRLLVGEAAVTMSDPSSTDLGEGEQAYPSSKSMFPQRGISEISQTKCSEADKSGPSRSPDVKAGGQLEPLVFPPKDDRKLSLSINLQHQTSLITLGLGHSLDLNSCPEEEAEKTLRTTFTTLPAELRVKIYKMTWEPRRVTLVRSWLAGQDDLREYQFRARTSDAYIYEFFDEDQVTTTTTSTAQLPVTFWINKESRYETLRHYEIAFACPKNGNSTVYFNFAIDELEIRGHGALKSIITADDLAKVKALIVPMGHKAARASYNTLDTLRVTHRVDNLDEKLYELYTRGLGSGLEPYSPEKPLQDTDLRRLAEALQRDIIEAQGLPRKLLSICPTLKRVHLLPTATCGHWPTENFATLEEEDDWFLKDNCDCLICIFHWTARHLGFLVADDPEEQVWSIGDPCPPGFGVDREMRLQQITVSWRARLDAAAWDPDDERCTARTVADWAVAGTAIRNKLVDPGEAEPIYML